MRLFTSATILLGVPLFAAPPTTVTFYKDVLPVLQEKCQTCHRPGEPGPMAFMTYQQTRPWAKAMKEAVALKRMPPWHADPAYGHFVNDPSLTPAQLQVLTGWAETGAKEGNAKDAPAPKQWVAGWNIGQPDLVIEMANTYAVPKEGTVDYIRFVLPTKFTEDRWVSAAELRPGNRAIVHHAIAYIRPKGSKWLTDAPLNEPIFKVKKSDDGEREFLVGYAPGMPPVKAVADQAILVPAGADLVLEMHYTPNGKDNMDQTRVGVTFAPEPPKLRRMFIAAADSKFAIPAGADSYPVDAKFTVRQPLTMTGLQPHMHLRGKSFVYKATYPTGETETLLNVPKYDFNWQHTYYLAQPKPLPAGTVIDCRATFDNSPNNPANPDPTQVVRYGDQSYEEMMIGFFEVVFDAKKTPAEMFRAPKKATPTPSAE